MRRHLLAGAVILLLLNEKLVCARPNEAMATQTRGAGLTAGPTAGLTLTAAFARPTVRLGEIVTLRLQCRHPAGANFIFPDSSADFRPFELVHQRYVPTRTRVGVSLDEVLYEVRTFAPDSTQTLALGGHLLTPHGDTVPVPGPTARIQLRFTSPPPDPIRPPALRPLLQTEPLPPRFNWPGLLAGAVGLGLAALGFWLLYGRTVRARYRRYRLRKNHQYFLTQYARLTERFTLSRSVLNLERTITLWKNYLTGLEDRPINSLTTKEIVTSYANDPRVARALRLGDRAIYGNQLPDTDDEAGTPTGADEASAALLALRTFAEERYAALAAPLAASLSATPADARPAPLA